MLGLDDLSHARIFITVLLKLERFQGATSLDLSKDDCTIWLDPYVSKIHTIILPWLSTPIKGNTSCKQKCLYCLT